MKEQDKLSRTKVVFIVYTVRESFKSRTNARCRDKVHCSKHFMFYHSTGITRLDTATLLLFQFNIVVKTHQLSDN